MSNDVAESINQQLIAGRFGHVGLRQLCTKLRKHSVRLVYIAEGGSVWPIKFCDYVYVCLANQITDMCRGM